MVSRPRRYEQIARLHDLVVFKVMSSKAGSSHPTGILKGPAGATLSRVGSNVGQEPVTAMTATPIPEGTVARLLDRVVEDTRRLNVALLDEESKKLRLEIREQGAAFHEALAELDAKMTSIKTEKNKCAEPEVIDQLTVAVQDTRRDANYALEELKRSHDDADERFGQVATRLKSLETAAFVGPSGQEVPSSENEREAPERGFRRGRSRKQKKPSKVVWKTKSSKYDDSEWSEEDSRSSGNESEEEKAISLSSDEHV